MFQRRKRSCSAFTLAFLCGFSVTGSGDVIDLFDSVDRIQVNHSPLLNTWLRDPLDRRWEKVAHDDGGETWKMEIAFPVDPRTREYRVTYQGQTIPRRDASDRSIRDVCFTLSLPEVDDLGYRVVFEREGSLARETTFQNTRRSFFRLRARGTHARGVYPVADLSLDSSSVWSWDVNASSWRVYTGVFVPPEGEGELRISFTNDGTNPKNGEDRNLYVDRGEVLYPGILLVHFPPGAAPSYTADGFEFRCHADPEVLLPALTQGDFLFPWLVDDEPRPPRDVLQDVEIDQISRRCLRLAAPTDLEWPVTLGEGRSQLRFTLASDDYGDSGCTFRLFVEEGEAKSLAWEQFLPPARDGSEYAWRQEEVDLTRWQGRRVNLRLTVDSGMPLHGPFERDKSKETSAGILFANPRLLTGEQPPDTNNLILICLDTLRADHLSCYGYERDTSPALDRFAAESVLFEYCVSASNSTLPSHGSLFTSLLSREHGAIFLPTRLHERSVTMAGSLREAGYRTVAFVDGGFLAPFYGFYQGFDIYDSQNGRARNVFPRAMQWIEKEGELGPFFMFIHVYDPHSPYNGEAKDGGYREFFDPHLDYSRISGLVDEAATETLSRIESGQLRVNRNDVEHIVALYDAGIRLLDDRLRELFEFLEPRGLFDDSLVVVISDHGEHFGERGYWLHGGISLFRELLHVPLLMRFPAKERAGLVIDEPVSLMDLMPTFCEFAGVPVPPSCRGVSLLPLIRGEGEGEGEVRDLLSEAMAGKTMALTNREAKAILNYVGEPVLTELFDVRYDRRERVNLAARETELAQEITNRLVPLLEIGAEAQDEKAFRDSLDPELEAQMKALGYLAR